MATTVTVYPPPGTTYPDAAGVPITSAGAIVDNSKYIRDAIRDGYLLTYDPLGIYQPDDRTDTGGGGGSASYASISALGLVTNASSNAVAFTTGYATAGDGGDGEWRWVDGDTTPANNGFIVGASVAGRWRRVCDAQYANVKWFGATGNGSTDDTVAVQAALDSVGTYGGRVYFPQGVYRITARLKTGILTGRANGNLHISGATGGPVNPTCLYWDGPATEAGQDSCMLQLAAFDSIVENLSFQVAPDKQVGCLLNFGYFPGETPAFVTGSTVESCHFAGGKDISKAKTLVAWDFYNIANGNGENCTLRKCLLYGATEQNAWLRGGQPFNIVFDNCFFNNAGMSTIGVHSPFGVGIRVDTAASQLHVNSCSFQRVGVHLYMANPPICTVIQNCESEQFKKILYFAAGGGGHNMTVSIIGGRYATNAVTEECQGILPFGAGDVQAIRYQPDAPLVIQGVSFFGNGSVSTPFKIFTCSADIFSSGNQYPNTNPFERLGPWDVNKRGRTFSSGDYAATPGGTKQAMPTLRGCENGGGTVTISGASTSANVVFQNPEPSATPSSVPITPGYQVSLSVQGVTGTPTLSTPYVSTPMTTSSGHTGFTISLPTAPGIGNSVTVAYEVWR